jgi:hypothetical protein
MSLQSKDIDFQLLLKTASSGIKCNFSTSIGILMNMTVLNGRVSLYLQLRAIFYHIKLWNT